MIEEDVKFPLGSDENVMSTDSLNWFMGPLGVLGPQVKDCCFVSSSHYFYEETEAIQGFSTICIAR